MSESQVEPQESNESSTSTAGEVKLGGLFAHKVGMSSVYNEAGQIIPVTVLKVDPWKVTQIKTKEKEGYNSLQISLFDHRKNKTSKASQKHTEKVDTLPVGTV